VNTLIPIHKLSTQTGLTSRTLRHWESEGLFRSERDIDSDWSVYDENAVLCIRITACLRQLNIPIKDVKTVLEKKTYDSLRKVIEKQAAFLRTSNAENTSKEKRLIQFMAALEKQDSREITDSHLFQLINGIKPTDNKNDMEENIMSNSQNHSLQFISLPPMRTVYNIAVSNSPEGEAMNPVLEWLESENLTGTARVFGGNMPPMPSGENPYGYGFCASIPESASIPEHLKEMRLPGGIYAMLPSTTDDVPASWKSLMKQLGGDTQYTSDRSRLCLEEHIRNDKNDFLLFLLEPVKMK
jgi:DNA-binding transcriptional MerR regulator/DNA gyrase inhibitor GyrI